MILNTSFIDGITGETKSFLIDWELPNFEHYLYCSGTEYSLIPGDVWFFRFEIGYQGEGGMDGSFYAWPVRDGDAVPIPASVFLLGSGIFGLGMLRKRFQ